MALTPEGRCVAVNLVEAMRFFGRGRRYAAIEEHPGVCLVNCGMDYAAFNSAVLHHPFGLSAPEFRRRVETGAEFFRKRRLRWTLWLCAEALLPDAARDLRPVLSKAGLTPLTEAPGFFAEALPPPRRPLPPLDVRPVADEPSRDAFAQIASVAFEIPTSICRDVYGSPGAWAGSFEGFVGYAAGQPVCTTAVVVDHQVAGIYSVATLPSVRRRGYAEAAIRHALQAVHRRTGITATVLQSSRSGLSLYERMGYRRVADFRVFMS